MTDEREIPGMTTQEVRRMIEAGAPTEITAIWDGGAWVLFITLGMRRHVAVKRDGSPRRWSALDALMRRVRRWGVTHVLAVMPEADDELARELAANLSEGGEDG